MPGDNGWQVQPGMKIRLRRASKRYDSGTGKLPRYYQLVAINRTVDAIARGENRILLVMATGTGKIYTAFQIIWRLWKSGAKKRILFLVDRNILADQTKTNDFKPFGTAMTKITNRTARQGVRDLPLALPGEPLPVAQGI